MVWNTCTTILLLPVVASSSELCSLLPISFTLLLARQYYCSMMSMFADDTGFAPRTRRMHTEPQTWCLCIDKQWLPGHLKYLGLRLTTIWLPEIGSSHLPVGRRCCPKCILQSMWLFIASLSDCSYTLYMMYAQNVCLTHIYRGGTNCRGQDLWGSRPGPGGRSNQDEPFRDNTHGEGEVGRGEEGRGRDQCC